MKTYTFMVGSMISIFKERTGDGNLLKEICFGESTKDVLVRVEGLEPPNKNPRFRGFDISVKGQD
ncbi:MAG: hypothetical protein ACKOX6_05745 [Bdellovibrio sp.]